MITTPAKWTASIAVAALLASGGFWTGKSLTSSTVTPQVSTGTVVRVFDGGEFTFRRTGASQFLGYQLPSTLSWRDSYGTWHDSGTPTCMKPETRGQRITLALFNAAPVDGAFGESVIVWLECPTKPIPHYPIVTPSAAAAGISGAGILAGGG